MANLNVVIPRMESFLEGKEFDRLDTRIEVSIYWHVGNDNEGAFHAHAHAILGQGTDVHGEGSDSGTTITTGMIATAVHDALDDAAEQWMSDDDEGDD